MLSTLAPVLLLLLVLLFVLDVNLLELSIASLLFLAVFIFKRESIGDLGSRLFGSIFLK